MDENQEQPKKKRAWRKKWTPKMFAKYLMSIDMKYVLPGVSDEKVYEEVPNLHCGLGKVNYLRNHAEFQKTVEEEFNTKIRSKHSTETMFWLYLKHSFESNMDTPEPSSKLLDVLGHLSGEYKPKIKKEKPGKKLTPAQAARLIHQKEQIEAKLNEKGNLEVNGKEGESNDGQ